MTALKIKINLQRKYLDTSLLSKVDVEIFKVNISYISLLFKVISSVFRRHSVKLIFVSSFQRSVQVMSVTFSLSVASHAELSYLPDS